MSDLSALKSTGIDIQTNSPLAPYTYIKIGGPAQYLAIVSKRQDLINLIQVAHKSNIPTLVLGGGSNVLVSDAGITGLVIINRTNSIKLTNQKPKQEKHHRTGDEPKKGKHGRLVPPVQR